MPVFGTFPRVGIPRAFASYADYVEAIDVLLRCDAFPEPTFLWWDVRLQPKLGTLEVRIMDAQTRAADNAALAALVQCAVRLEATEGYVDDAIACTPGGARREPLPRHARRHAGRVHRPRSRRPAGRRATILDELLAACAPHAAELGCEAELAAVGALAAEPGDHRQRLLAGVAQGDPIGPGARDARVRARERLHRRARRAAVPRWPATLAWHGQRVSATARRASISCGLRA